MRILMFGRGAIATIYAHALQTAGHDVQFYVRPGRAAEYGSDVALELVDARRGRRERSVRVAVPTRLRESYESGDRFDLIVLSVGHQRLASAIEFLAPRIGDATLLVFGNVWGEPLSVISPIPAEQVVFGFPQAGGGFGDDGVLRGALFSRVIIGLTGASSSRRDREIAEVFTQAGFAIRREQDLRGWLWLHFVFDAGMHAEGLRLGGLAGLIGNRRGLRDAMLTSRELLPMLRARGVDLRRHLITTAPWYLARVSSVAMAWATARLPIAQVSLAAHADPTAAEALAVLQDASDTARGLGVPSPRLDAALARR